MFSAFEANFNVIRQKTIAKANLCYYQEISNGNKRQPGHKTWEMKVGQEFSFCHILLQAEEN